MERQGTPVSGLEMTTFAICFSLFIRNLVPMIPSAPASSLVDSIHASIHTVEPAAPVSFTLSRPANALGSTSSTRLRLSGVSLTGGLESDPSSLESRARVPMSDLLDAFKACLAYDLAWIEDFSDDEVEISQDLFGVLQAFAELRRQSADEAQD
jgi:hypothetical protein